MEKEIPLSGGNITGVVRIGQTVHRATGPWSPTVHHLLLYLEAQNFEGTPRFLGFDQRGREILSFIPGEVGNYPLQNYMWSDENVTAAAHFLRRYHDAIAGYTPPDNAIWQFSYPDQNQHEIICHNDFAPYNMVYSDRRPLALIDWDTAGPGPRIWDIAYAVYRFVPLSYALDMQRLGLADPTTQARRLRLFSLAYGLTISYEELLNVVERRIETMANLLLERAQEPAYQKMIDEGHLAHYQREVVALRRNRKQLAHYLSPQ